MNKIHTIILTGVSKGLGQAFFDNLHYKKLILICLSRRFHDYQQVIAKNSSNINLINVDFSDLDSLKQMLIKIDPIVKNTISKEVTFINNAGIVEPIGPVGDIEFDQCIASVNTNFISPICITNYIFEKKYFKKIKIINISSGAANKAIEGWAMYCSAKAGAKMFFDVLSLQFRNNENVQICHIDPGVMDTDMQVTIRNADYERFPQIEYFVKLKDEEKLQKPKDVANKIISEYLNL